MSDSTQFLESLYGVGYAETIDIHIGDDIFTATIDDLQTEAEPFRFYPTGEASNIIAFVYGAEPDADLEAWKTFKLRPTAVLAKETVDDPGYGLAVYFWALEMPVEGSELQSVLDKFNVDLEEAIPTPSMAGWTLLHADPNEAHTVEALLERYGASLDDELPVDGEALPEASVAVVEPNAVEEDAPWEEPAKALEESTWNGARIITPGWDPESDPDMKQVFGISLGAKTDSKDWQSKNLTGLKLLENLTTPMEGKKDGAAFVGGHLVGTQRKSNAVKAIYVPGLDIDVGMPIEDAVEILRNSGKTGVLYTTHSHMKTRLDLAKSKVLKFADANGLDSDDLGDEAVQGVLKEQNYYPYIYENARYLSEEHTENGIVVEVETPPIPKFRVVFFLEEPFVIQEVDKDQQKAINIWKKQIIPNLATSLGLPYDHTGVDPARLFYLPRYAKGRPHESIIFGGKLLKWQDYLDQNDELADAVSGMVGPGKTSKTKTPAGKGLGEWWSKRATGFMAADLFQDRIPDEVRATVSLGLEVTCPFDEEHSNAGDPNDRACMISNMGELSPDYFTFKCQHEGCRQYTSLDMLGKCITNDWFTEDDLWSEDFNAVENLEGKSGPKPPIMDVPGSGENPDKTLLEEFNEATADFNKETPTQLIRDVIKKYANGPDVLEIENMIKRIYEKTGFGKRILKGMFKEYKEEEEAVEKSAESATIYHDRKSKKTVFQYYGGFHSDEAVDLCREQLDVGNKIGGVRVPTYTVFYDKPTLMTVKDDGRVDFREMDPTTLWTELNNRIAFQRKTDAGAGHRDQIPKDVSAEVYYSAWKSLPPVPEVLYTPVFDEDGTLLQDLGWWENERIYMADIGFNVPPINAKPSKQEAQDALHYMLDTVLGDFPFSDVDKEGMDQRAPSEASALAMILTPFMRRMIQGCTPVFFVAKPQAGTGGTLLGKTPMLLMDGEESHPMTYCGQNDEEQKKALMAAIMETRTHLFFDDVREFNNRVLLQAITSRKLGGRVLGKTENIERPNTFNWIATGNNPHIDEEMSRRICWIWLNAKTVNQQTRQYKHSNFPGFLSENRPEIVHNILTLIQYWISLDQPKFTERKLVSFEDWGAKVGGVLQAVGVKGFLSNPSATLTDVAGVELRKLVKSWYEGKKHEKITLIELFSYIENTGAITLSGNTDDQKRARFRSKIMGIQNRLFEVQTKEGKIEVTVRRTIIDDEEEVYLDKFIPTPYIAPVPDKK